jgi:hypothetical protein
MIPWSRTFDAVAVVVVTQSLDAPIFYVCVHMQRKGPRMNLYSVQIFNHMSCHAIEVLKTIVAVCESFRS